MSYFYEDMARSAQELLNEFGQLATLNKVTQSYDPATSETTTTTASVTGAGAVIEYRLGEIDGTLVLETDKRLLLTARGQGGALMPVPQPGDTIRLHASDVTLRVVRSTPIAPAGQNVAHDVQLRA